MVQQNICESFLELQHHINSLEALASTINNNPKFPELEQIGIQIHC